MKLFTVIKPRNLVYKGGVIKILSRPIYAEGEKAKIRSKLYLIKRNICEAIRDERM
jgi:predicted DNA-binding antitoxin AbrB/MazE fold protein